MSALGQFATIAGWFLVIFGIDRAVRRRGRSERAKLRRLRRDARRREMALRRMLADMMAIRSSASTRPSTPRCAWWPPI